MSLATRSSQFPVSVADAIFHRRSTRKFTQQPVSREEIDYLLAAASQAPSNLNLQPWTFAVIQNREELTNLSEASKKVVFADPDWPEHTRFRDIPVEDPGFDIFYGASTLLVIYLNQESKHSREGECFLAAQNMMLAAYAVGLATCPIGYALETLDSPEYRGKLAVPPSCRAVFSLVVGYSGSSPSSPGRAPPKVSSWLR